jgi:hypothetical protein
MSHLFPSNFHLNCMLTFTPVLPTPSSPLLTVVPLVPPLAVPPPVVLPALLTRSRSALRSLTKRLAQRCFFPFFSFAL